MCEVLAPAGDEEAFFAAVNSGADAVYLGLSDFSARRGAKNFTAEQFSRCAAAAHALGVRVYVALSTPSSRTGNFPPFLNGRGRRGTRGRTPSFYRIFFSERC